MFLLFKAAIINLCRFYTSKAHLMRKRIFGIFSIFLLFSFGCGTINNPDETTILNVDNEFEISIKEILENNERSISFEIISLEEQECEETKLYIKKRESSDQLNIDITDIIFPETCGAKGSYPIGTVSFEVLERLYKLEVNVNDIINHKGVLEVSDNIYRLGLENVKGLIATKNILNRVPDNFVWGYFDSNIIEELNSIENLFASLNLEMHSFSEFPVGYYSYFSIDDQGKIEVEAAEDITSAISFGFENVSIKSLQADINEFKYANPNINIQFFGSDGSSF